MLAAFIEGVGVWGPGLPGWEKAAEVLRGDSPYNPGPAPLPVLEILAPAERRRVAPATKLALSVGWAALADARADGADIRSVFASSGGDGETINAILATLATANREVSPTRFHNSVHNAPSGYWSLATRSHAPSTTVSAHDYSFAAGLIEAMTQISVDEDPVLLIAYDQPYPEPLHRERPLIAGFGVALLMSHAPSPRASARITLSLEDGTAAGTTLRDRELEALRLGNPAARALPLLRLLACGRDAAVILDGAGADRLVVSCYARPPGAW